MKYIIDFKNDTADEKISEYLNLNGCTVIQQWSNFDKVYLVESSAIPPTTDFTEFVIEDLPTKIKPLNVVEINQYWSSLQDPNAEKIEIKAHDQKDWWKNYSYINPEFDKDTLSLSRVGKGVVVYIMDSGIEKTHPEFSEAEIEDLYTIIPDDFEDKKGHGTGIASVIAGKTCGISSAKIKNVKIFEPGHNTLQSELLSALDAILEDHEENNFAIVNCSWAIDKNAWIEYKFRQLIGEGVWVITSAGNNGTSIEDVTPASMPEVVTVGSYNQDLVPCDFSNYTGESIVSLTNNQTNHGELDGWAPGNNIWVAGLNGTYGYVAGTSISAGILSAIVSINASHWIDTDGSKISASKYWRLSSINPEALAVMAFGRPDLLDLTNEKYSQSKNLIATIIDRSVLPVKLPPDEFLIQQRVGVESVSMHVLEPSMTSKIEWIEPLPPNFKIVPTGNIWAAPTESEGPQNGEPYKLYNSSFIRTHAQTGEQELVKMKIYVLAADFTPDAIPKDHELNVALNFNFCSGPLFASCGAVVYTSSACLNNCSNGYCCGEYSPSPKGGAYYDCICGPSDIRLKSDIKKIGTHKLGIDLYEYTIMGKRQTGVMAHELLKVKSEAVRQNLDGYYYVNYSLIDD